MTEKRRFHSFLLALILAVAPATAFCQWAKDSLIAIQKLEKAVVFLKKNRPVEAAASFENCLEICRQADQLAAWIRAHRKFAEAIFDHQNQPFQAIDLLEKAASQPFRACKTTDEWGKTASCRNFQSWLAETAIGDFSLAKLHLDQAWILWNDHLRDDFGTGFYVLKNLGNILTRLGDFERAELLLSEAQKMARDEADFSNAAFAASDLSIVFQCRGELKKAISTAADALRFPEIDAENRAYLFSNLSECYRLSGRLTEAEKATREGFRLLPEIDDEDARMNLRSEFFSEQAENFAAAKNFPAAEKSFRTALFWAKQYYQNDDRREIGKLHIALGHLFLKQKNGPKALAEFQIALRSVIKNFSQNNPDSNPTAVQFYPENTIAEALAGKALAWKIEFDRTRKPACLENALACHELALDVGDQLRETFQFESSSLQALDESRDLLEQATEIAHLLFENSGDEKFKHRAFFFAERSKGLLLLQGLARAKSDFKLPPELRNREQDLNSRFAFLQKQIFEEKTARRPDLNRLRDLESQRMNIAQAREKFMVELQKRAPDYFELTRKTAFVAAAEVPSILRDGQAMVEYLVGERHLFVFFFDKNGLFSLRKTPIPADFTANVDTLRGYLQKYGSDVEARNHFVGIAQNFYALLLGPELAALKIQPTSLVIAPDGELGFIPFEVLLEPQNGPAAARFQWKNLPFLLKKWPISYAWSATLLREQLAKKSPEGLRQLAGFAPIYSTENPKSNNPKSNNPQSAIRNPQSKEAVVPRSGDRDLPGAQAEMDLLDRLIGGDFYRKQAAKKADFLREAGRYRVLQLAMHAVTDNENPAFSHLKFTPEPGDTTTANCLYVNELQQLRLFAELAVLSACNTGDGRLHRGEGVFSLARAFALAGVPATLMSLWELSDKSAPALMTVFYKNLQAGKTKDESLQLAKLAWLEESGPPDAFSNHPFFWSGLVANGKMSPIELRPRFPFFAWAAGIGGLAALFLWAAARRKSKKLPSPASRF